MLLERHYQNAYVTPDIDRAMDALTRRFGVDFNIRLQVDNAIRTPQGDGVARIDMALGWVGDLQYELIQPLSGMIDIYSEAVRPDRLLTFHHVAMRVLDWDALQSEIDHLGLSTVLQGESGTTKFLYVDGRETFGHYLEYMQTDPESWARIGGK
jgi:hypothetical protein